MEISVGESLYVNDVFVQGERERECVACSTEQKRMSAN